MVNYSTNINKTNNHLSPQLFEHKKNATFTTYLRNPRTGKGKAQKCFLFFFN
jgi:hypothetical protein